MRCASFFFSHSLPHVASADLTCATRQKLSGLLEHLLESSIIADGVLAQDETQVLSLWSLRETLPEAAGKLGKVYKYDLSMPVKDMYSLVEEARVRFSEKGMAKDGSIMSTIGYGHLGDGELALYLSLSFVSVSFSFFFAPSLSRFLAI